MTRVEEWNDAATFAIWRHPDWYRRFPWLEQGTTGRGSGGEPSDFGLFGSTPVGETTRRWRELRETVGMATAVHARQVHHSAVATWRAELPSGFVLTDGFDAHVTTRPGILLTVSVADCVPIFLVNEEPRAIALVHAGWRGIVAGVLEAAVAEVVALARIDASTLRLHTGPSICGECYEVGPEVHAAVAPDRAIPAANTPIDLVNAIADRAARVGIRREHMTASEHCTRCGPGAFFSHRAGSAARQLGVLGIRS